MVINQDLKLPWGISSQDLSKLREGSINMDIIQVYLTRFLSQQDEKLCEKDPTLQLPENAMIRRFLISQKSKIGWGKIA